MSVLFLRSFAAAMSAALLLSLSAQAPRCATHLAMPQGYTRHTCEVGVARVRVRPESPVRRAGWRSPSAARPGAPAGRGALLWSRPRHPRHGG